MERTTLVFKTLLDMRRFQATITVHYLEMKSQTLTIVCDCAQADIDRAVRDFGATIVINPS
jgi:hypothetical protein